MSAWPLREAHMHTRTTAFSLVLAALVVACSAPASAPAPAPTAQPAVPQAGVVPEPVPVLIESRAIGVRFDDVQRAVGRQLAAMMVVGPSMLSRGDASTTRF